VLAALLFSFRATGGQVALSELRHVGEQVQLPARDSEDQQDLPVWFRGLLRQRLQGLPEVGMPQYPRCATAVLQWLEAHESVAPQELSSVFERLQEQVPMTVEENARRQKYPREWNIEIPEGSRLAELRARLDQQTDLLPAGDPEDESPLPPWFRVYLRKQMSGLGQSGPYQYPRESPRILNALVKEPDAESLEPMLQKERAAEAERNRRCLEVEG